MWTITLWDILNLSSMFCPQHDKDMFWCNQVMFWKGDVNRFFLISKLSGVHKVRRMLEDTSEKTSRYFVESSPRPFFSLLTKLRPGLCPRDYFSSVAVTVKSRYTKAHKNKLSLSHSWSELLSLFSQTMDVSFHVRFKQSVWIKC